MVPDPKKIPRPMLDHGDFVALWMFDQAYAYVHRYSILALVPIVDTAGHVAGATVLLGPRHIEVMHAPDAIRTFLERMDGGE